MRIFLKVVFIIVAIVCIVEAFATINGHTPSKLTIVLALFISARYFLDAIESVEKVYGRKEAE